MSPPERSAGRRALRWYLVLAALLVASAGLYLRRPLAPAGFSGETMGTTYTVKLGSTLSREAHRELIAQVEGLLRELEGRFSTYVPTSEVSRLAGAPVGQPFALSPDVAAALIRARQVSEASGGAFDVTVRPLVDAWGFGPPGHRKATPREAEMDALLARVGYRHLELDAAARSATRRIEGLSVDLSGVAKGYAVDRVARALEARGHAEYLVEIGGEVRAAGKNLARRPWRVALDVPGPGPRAVFLDGQGLATSGNYRNFYDLDGQRFVHIVDPRSGRMVRHRLVAVSVIHDDTALADAWATALMVLGEVDGPRVAEDNDLAALFTIAEGERAVRQATPRFAAFTRSDP